MIAENAAFMYALLRAPSALHPLSIFRRYFPLSNSAFGSQTLDRLRQILAYYEDQERYARGQSKAFLQLLYRDAEHALSFLRTDDLSWFDLMATIQEYYEVAEDYYKVRLGLDWVYSPPMIVDKYPEPAQEADWFAMSRVPGGPRPGYPQGIYALRRHMMPGVAELAILHENVHQLGVGGPRGKGGYYRFFDEGCCNFLAYLVYLHRNQKIDAIQLYRRFLHEVNYDLYEHPSFDRIMASLVQQIGVGGLYRLILRRVSEPDSVDWREVLRATAGADMRVTARSGEPSDSDLPKTVLEMEDAAEKIISLIVYPERVVISPVAYMAYDWMCREGSLGLEELQATWQLSGDDVSTVVQELARKYLWTLSDDRLIPGEYKSDLLHATGMVRAGVMDLTPIEA